MRGTRHGKSAMFPQLAAGRRGKHSLSRFCHGSGNSCLAISVGQPVGIAGTRPRPNPPTKTQPMTQMGIQYNPQKQKKLMSF